MVLPLLEGDSCITLRHPVSLPYIDLTLEVMLRFGVYVDAMPDVQSAGFRYRIPGGQLYRPTEVRVPRDWSAAAAIMAAAAVSSAAHQGSKCVVKGLGAVHVAAPDSVVIEALCAAGVLCTPMEADWEISVPHGLRPFVFDLTHAPDLAPALAALAAYTSGVSLFRGAGRLTGKESSRGEVLVRILSQLGIKANLEDDELAVHGGNSVEPIAGAVIDSHHDHRIAMAAAAIAAAAIGPVTLSGESCVAKTYPRFWDDLASLGLRIQEIR